VSILIDNRFFGESECSVRILFSSSRPRTLERVFFGCDGFSATHMTQAQLSSNRPNCGKPRCRRKFNDQAFATKLFARTYGSRNDCKKMRSQFGTGTTTRALGVVLF
jgi:hypothetical protein